MGSRESADSQRKAAVPSKHTLVEHQSDLLPTAPGSSLVTPGVISTLQRTIGNAATRHLIANAHLGHPIIQRVVQVQYNGHTLEVDTEATKRHIVESLLDRIAANGAVVDNADGAGIYKVAPVAWTLQELEAAVNSLSKFRDIAGGRTVRLSKLAKHPTDPSAFGQYKQGNISLFAAPGEGVLRGLREHSHIRTEDIETTRQKLQGNLRYAGRGSSQEQELTTKIKDLDAKFPKSKPEAGRGSFELTRATLLHELAHAHSEKDLTPKFQTFWEDEETLENGAEEPPTRYGHQNIDEDISDSVAIYLLDRPPGRAWLETQRPQRFAIIDEWYKKKMKASDAKTPAGTAGASTATAAAAQP
ncbi:MAG: hypothetical protein K8J31_30710 [Anaerolineae bacterium]|nr:hypothetical protein [Anaerolineae bacterium]